MEIALSTLLFFDREADPRRDPAVHRHTRAIGPKRLYCAQCRYRITHPEEGIAVRGAHEHTFANPHGMVFHIGCFRAAPGCAAGGAATMEHTWFPGYAWRIALCRRCATHLGWTFTAPADGFYGLIVDRLSSTGPAEN